MRLSIRVEGLSQATAPLLHSKIQLWFLALIGIPHVVLSSENTSLPTLSVYDLDVTSGSGGTGVLWWRYVHCGFDEQLIVLGSRMKRKILKRGGCTSKSSKFKNTKTDTAQDVRPANAGRHFQNSIWGLWEGEELSSGRGKGVKPGVKSLLHTTK